MDNLEIAKALFGQKPIVTNSNQTTTAYGIAESDSSSGVVMVNLGGDTVSPDDDQIIEVETTFAVKEGDEVIISMYGADESGKTPVVTGVVGRGDQQQVQLDEQGEEIQHITNYFWTDEAGAHVSTEAGSVEGANILLDSDSLDIRNGASNSESDQTVYASFGREVTVGSRRVVHVGDVGQYSQVFGNGCSAGGEYSHAEGYHTQADGNYSHTEGINTSASGNYSHAEGYGSWATGQASHAEGTGSEASGYQAHAEGYNTIASGNYSHTEGYRTTAAGNYGHAEGNLSSAYLDYGHAEGFNTKAGNYGHSEGYGTIAVGGSHSEGLYTVATSRYQHVQGIANFEDDNNVYLDIVGNGTVNDEDSPSSVTARSNAYNLDRLGNAEFKGGVYVGGCTPNGETPHPVIRYNRTTFKQEYYNGVGWIELASEGITSLWVNNAPTSNFAAQTLPLDLSKWEWIGIYASFNTSTTDNVLHIVKVGDETLLNVPNLSGTQYFAKRRATVSTTGIVFATGYRNTTGTSGANYAIPKEIIGIARTNGGGSSAWSLLWTNTDLTVGFAPQTVSLDLSTWSTIAVKVQYYITDSSNSIQRQIHMISVGDICLATVNNVTYFNTRRIETSASGVQFFTGYRIGQAGTSDNYAIPVAIYGVN